MIAVAGLVATPNVNAAYNNFVFSDNGDYFANGVEYAMYNDGTSVSGTVFIGATMQYDWGANAPATVETNFGGTVFTLKLNLGVGGLPTDATAQVGYVADGDGVFYMLDGGIFTLNDLGQSPDETLGDGIFSGSATITGLTVTVQGGDYLAVDIIAGLTGFTILTSPLSPFSL